MVKSLRLKGVVAYRLLQVVEEGFSEEDLVLLWVLKLEDIFGKLPEGILNISLAIVQGFGKLGDVQGIIQPLCLENFVLDLILAFIESFLAKLDDLILKGNEIKGRLLSLFRPHTVNCLFARISSFFSIC